MDPGMVPVMVPVLVPVMVVMVPTAFLFYLLKLL
jgi:hypothetical protein